MNKEEIVKLIQYQDALNKKYPNAVKLWNSYKEGNELGDVIMGATFIEKTKEILDIYQTAIFQGYQSNKEDKELYLVLGLISKPNFLDDLIAKLKKRQ